LLGLLCFRERSIVEPEYIRIPDRSTCHTAICNFERQKIISVSRLTEELRETVEVDILIVETFCPLIVIRRSEFVFASCANVNKGKVGAWSGSTTFSIKCCLTTNRAVNDWRLTPKRLLNSCVLWFGFLFCHGNSPFYFVVLTPWRSAAAAKRRSVCIALFASVSQPKMYWSLAERFKIQFSPELVSQGE